ncbi:trans-sialidase, putative [Trypanosoma cruzi]|uniref:Trans-sialidase, putative n=1 Tax=Trypanosoma cruzi (strain CL Brener) TaxID=353153 RepID=Q4DUN8_TRYCC|nr:trans-sialidase, putative [Trypanosoma cruzi]EAN96245.1 trans-sialidase, putative [Trypanosoma cruzi]|eukprot:XP_818096.1 trans-sialidase [Trypanosoma cruzi strain CL Brener]
MFSRVAAVKAPRTQNRRCVTGSSGRRREGRESEPQRPNMSRHLFYSAVLLLLLVAMMCCNAGGAQQTIKTAPDPRSLPKTYFVWRDKKGEETVVYLRVPSLVEVKGDVFAVAEAPCKDGGEKAFTGIASEVLTLSDEESKELDKNAVKTQVLEECAFDKKSGCHIAGQDDSKTQTRVLLSRPTTVVKGSDIYMLAGNYSWTLAAGVQGADAGDWGLVLVKGNVSNEKSQKRIFWNDTYAIPWNYNKKNESLALLVGSGGSGVKMEDGTLVFPVEGTRKKTTNQVGTEEDEKTVSLIIHSLKDTNSWTLSKGMSDGGCSDPSVVEWEDKKLIMLTACGDGCRRVYESGDKGESWTEALGTLSRVWGNKQGEGGVRSGFITATIDDVDDKRNVMLVTLPVYPEKADKKEAGNGKSELHLWLTDNTHIVDIGPVSGDDAAASSLLYKSDGSGDKKELIALYEKKKDGEESSPSMVSVLLTEQLQRVKDVLATWKKVDDLVSELCPSESDVESASPEDACSTTDVKITDGLVGFLSGNLSENTWRDEYLGVNATVKKKEDAGETGATNTSDGVKFRGAWAEWPVGKQGENQLYHFANYDFTLVATVSIDKVPQGDTPVPLLGVHLEGKDKLMELSYDSEKKWQVLCSDGKIKKLKSTWATEIQHQVAIVLRNGTHGTAYVDGKRVCVDAQRSSDNTEGKKISHFYIGGDGGSADNTRSREDVSVTVRNVFLYNRPLTFSGGNANLEEDSDSPSADQEPSAEPASPFVSTDKNVAPSVGELPEAPVEPTTPQQPQQERETQKSTTVGTSATTQEVPANTSQGSVGKAAASNSHAIGEASGDAVTVRGSGLLPLLPLLLGLWVFAAL